MIAYIDIYGRFGAIETMANADWEADIPNGCIMLATGRKKPLTEAIQRTARLAHSGVPLLPATLNRFPMLFSDLSGTARVQNVVNYALRLNDVLNRLTKGTQP